MKVLGLVVEYNPFHNGHAYHLEKSKELSKADYIVCVMSGNFIQRGEPAVVNKWSRTKMALQSGADLVVELPVVYAMASAEYFSFGAVKILDSLGIVDCICFGSEHGEVNDLDSIAEVLSDEPEKFKEALKSFLGTGLSYPSAREKALSAYFSGKNLSADTINRIIGASNNILGIEYLKALRKLGSRINPLTIKRISNNYNSTELTGEISSATSIRNYFKNSSVYSLMDSKLRSSLPHISREVLEDEFSHGRGPVFADAFDSILLYELRKQSAESLSLLPYMSEGLENRIKKAAAEAGSFDEMLDYLCTKRYTRTRLQRILFNALLGITSKEFESFNTYGGPQYIRVLGFNQKGREMLGHINRKATLPVIIKAADYRYSCNPLFKRMFELEAIATDIYVLGYNNPAFRKAGQEFTQNVVIIK